MCIVCDETNNTPEDLAAGRLNVDIPTHMQVVIEMEDGSERTMNIPLGQYISLVAFVEEMRNAE